MLEYLGLVLVVVAGALVVGAVVATGIGADLTEKIGAFTEGAERN